MNTDLNQNTTPIPEATPPVKQKSSGLIGLMLVLIILLLGSSAYLFYQNTQLKKQIAAGEQASATPSPTANSNLPKGQGQGNVTGKLCYPSDFLPPGEIVAKDTSSGQSYDQDYPGSTAGGKLTYTLNLPVGTYHIRYQAHASTKEPDIFTSGYYTECAKTTHTNECSVDSGHVNIDVTVTPGGEVKNIDLCDFYYNQKQEQSLNQTF